MNEKFRRQICCNGATWKQVIERYAHDHELEQVWCPQYVHVYEMIGEHYKNFSWKIDVECRSVRFRNYPCHELGEPPTLYELASGMVAVDENYEFVRPERRHRHRKVWQPRQCRPVDTWYR